MEWTRRPMRANFGCFKHHKHRTTEHDRSAYMNIIAPSITGAPHDFPVLIVLAVGFCKSKQKHRRRLQAARVRSFDSIHAESPCPVSPARSFPLCALTVPADFAPLLRLLR